MTDTKPDAFSTLAQARTSVRGFTDQPVPDALLHELLVSARLAPSGANLQPGSFVQVRGAVREAHGAGAGRGGSRSTAPTR